jgi:hypothetical protein
VLINIFLVIVGSIVGSIICELCAFLDEFSLIYEGYSKFITMLEIIFGVAMAGSAMATKSVVSFPFLMVRLGKFH